MNFTDFKSDTFAANLPRALEIVLWLLIALVVVGWFIHDRDNLNETITSGDAIMQQNEAGDADLAAAPLFGKAGAQTQPIRKVKPQPAVQPLLIRLLGTVVAGENSAAIVASDQKGEQRVIFVDSSLAPGTRLVEVTPNAITIERSGRREQIMLEKGKALLSTRPLINSTRFGNNTVPQPGISSPGRVSQAGLAQILSGVRLQPHFANGRQDGLLVAGVTPGSMLEAAGLMNGDLVQKVNDTPVTGIAQILQLVRNLQAGDVFDAELMRDGQPVVISVELP